MSHVSDVLRDRMQEPAGLQKMVTVSLGLHGLVVVGLLLSPQGLLSRPEAPRSVMTITLGGGGAGPQEGGLTSIGGRPVQVETPPEEAPKREAMRAPAAKAPEMVVPEKNAKPLKAGSTAVKQALDEARGRTPTKGAEARPGSAIAETAARGQGFGLTSGGGPGSGSSLDVTDFCCPDYIVTMVERIRGAWDQRAAAGGMVIVKFTIQRDGTLTDSRVEKSSGYTDLDIAARRAVIVTRQLPPLPQAFPNPTLGVNLTFQYQR